MSLADWDPILIWLTEHPETPRHLVRTREQELRAEESDAEGNPYLTVRVDTSEWRGFYGTYTRTEPSEDAITAAFYALYGRKGGRPRDDRDGPELVAVHKALVAAYAIDFGSPAGTV